MIKFVLKSFGLLILIASFSSCFSYGKFLSSEHSMLKRIASSELQGKNKVDSVLTSSVRMMRYALRPINPVKGGKFVGKYFRQNQGVLQQIMADVSKDFSQMNLGQQAVFALSLAQKPYVKDFIKLYPRFRRKYKTVKTAGKYLGFMGKSVGGLGKLDFLLGTE